ncbi:MAG: endonuclease/exonuclease/phosphatase family protein [Burkholderiales bacterium]|nr:endonuclease/exonuclease/phosphatase family protein [Burkholderiales bacterium]
MRLVLATYNVHGCIGRDARFDPARTLGVLRELDADVIALQELQWDPGEARHLLAEFGRQLGYSALAGPTLMRGDGHYGNALLTRLGVRGVDRIDLSLPGREPRGALDASLDAGSAALRVIATHLGLRPEERRAQMRRLLALMSDRASAPLILMGDLNEWFLWGRPLRWLRRHFGRTPAPSTFPAAWPLFALDRIWVEPGRLLGKTCAHSSPLARAASDHLPLRAELNLPPA